MLRTKLLRCRRTGAGKKPTKSPPPAPCSRTIVTDERGRWKPWSQSEKPCSSTRLLRQQVGSAVRRHSGQPLYYQSYSRDSHCRRFHYEGRSMTDKVMIYVADAGSISKGNFHWVSSVSPAAESNDIAALAESICLAARVGRLVAVGLECPLFVPCPAEPQRLGLARPGETDPAFGSRPFNAGAGASATLTGFQALGWVLREVRRQVYALKATTRWDEFGTGECRLLLWEAFVSGSEKGRATTRTPYSRCGPSRRTWTECRPPRGSAARHRCPSPAR